MEASKKPCDRFGQSLSRPTTIEETAKILEEVETQLHPTPLSNRQIAALELSIFSRHHKYGIFRSCVIYLDIWKTLSDSTSSVIASELEIIFLDVRMYGGEVKKHGTSNVTHVIIDT